MEPMTGICSRNRTELHFGLEQRADDAALWSEHAPGLPHVCASDVDATEERRCPANVNLAVAPTALRIQSMCPTALYVKTVQATQSYFYHST